MGNPMAMEKKVGFWGLRNKVLAPAVLITVLTGGLLTLQSTIQMRELVYQDQAAQGMILAYFLVFDVNDNVLHAKASGAREFLSEYKEEHGAAYIFVQDGGGRILADTFDGQVPDAVQKLVESQKGKTGIQKEEISLGSLRLLDLRVPFVGASGHVHLGMALTQAQQQIRQLTLRAVGIVLALLLAGIGLLWMVMDRMVRPIRALTATVQKIMREGDLEQAIQVQSRDEIGQLAYYFSQMMVSRREVQSDLANTVLVLNKTVRDLEALSGAQNDAVTVQATALQETQVTAQEIKQTSQVAARKAEEILKMAEKADEIGRTGAASVEQSLNGLMDIRSQVREIAGKIGDLTDRTRQIGSITDTVKDLADQSNILALNAAIEAVRSGEHGKGFGLVAREIRRLADQSIQSTARVREILDSISDAIGKVAQITESGSQRMEGGYQLVKASGENLKALAGVVNENAASVRQIATAVEQQNTGIGQIFGAVTDQTRMMSESVKHVEAVGGMVKVLKDASGRLSAAIGR